MRRLARAVVVAGTAATVLGLSKAHALRNGYDYTASSRFGWSLAYVALLTLAAYGAGLPDLVRSRRSALAAAAGSTAVAATGISLAQLVAGSALLPRFVVLGAPAVLVPVHVLCSALSRDGRAHDRERDRVVVVAGPEEAFRLSDDLDAGAERPAVLTAVLDPATASSAGAGRRPLVEAATEARATAVVLDRAAQADESIVAQAAALHEAGVRVRTLALFYDQWLGKLPVSELERVALMFDIGELHRARYGRLKRIADVILATAGLVVLVAALPIALAGNALANQGPLFFRQARVGKRGREFDILKLRTMRVGPPGPSAWTSPDDHRVTRFGAWLRRTHLDELPQVVNVLRGDLSIVGPRPEQPHYVAELAEKIPFYALRHLVRPGLTGWAQVKYPYGSTEGDAIEKLQYEFYSLRHQGLALDLRILARTIRTVVRRAGR